MTNKMSAVLLTGYGGLEKLEWRPDVPVPVPGENEVLIRVGGCGINNTDINTRLGWYAKDVTAATSDATETASEDAVGKAAWSGQALSFPRIQGADVCGEIVQAGSAVDAARIGERVIVIPMQRFSEAVDAFDFWTLGADGDGGYAEYVKVRADQAITVNSDLSDIELASFPCAYSTAENLLTSAGLAGGESVLITGASGGVGSAAVQLARLRGAEVIAVASSSKADRLREIGASRVVHRETPLRQALPENCIDVVIDVVGGDEWPQLLEVLKRGGRYAVAGAIAGPIVELDLRTLYLKDLSLYGRTVQHPDVFPRLVQYIEQGRLKPLIAESYPLSRIREAQTAFMQKRFIGKIVMYPVAAQA